ncbi:MAG: MerR family transcriptional regulator [Scytonematopsis contorta HA4267-MV1]|jgi:DNA-binding transcriptional MerR regulator|nr:MerR family transcriptional regulator [Scytonematopsis contorta HA4267-MV1]
MDVELTIQQVAELTKLSVHTLRYYERIGLLAAINRAANGHRRYSSQDIAWIEFLTRLRTTGMPIRQMQQFAEMRRKGNPSVSQRRELLEVHEQQVQQQLKELSQNLSVIQEKIHYYKQLELQNDPSSKSESKQSQRKN